MQTGWIDACDAMASIICNDYINQVCFTGLLLGSDYYHTKRAYKRQTVKWWGGGGAQPEIPDHPLTPCKSATGTV